MTYHFLMTAPTLAVSGQKALADAGCQVTYIKDSNNAAEVEHLTATLPIDAIISRTVKLTAVAINQCPTLKVISKHGVGVNNIDVDAATNRHIPVFTTPGTNAVSVAELAIGLMIASARRTIFFNKELHAGQWTRINEGRQLKGLNLGLIGFGQIGRHVAHIAHAMGLHISVFDPAIKSMTIPDYVTPLASAEAVMKQADILSLHVPANDHTRNMINEETIALLPDQAIIINTARGELIDEKALITALESGKLFGAGLDTFTHEPLLSDDPLVSAPNIIMSPHIGGATEAALNAVSTSAVENCLRFLNGQTVDPSRCVNPQVLT